MTAFVNTSARSSQRWTNRSVLLFAQDADPVDTITARARDLVFEAFESGWSGPPYDPFRLAELKGIEVSPSKDVVDARTIPLPGKKLRIEFNPDRRSGRINYSIAHELGHSLFPDCAEIVRNRIKHSGATRDEWQLEMLCNIAAAEILMPIGTLRRDDVAPSIDRLIELVKQYCVSSEAVLLRILRLTPKNCFGFAAHREPDLPGSRYQIDYASGSRGWSAQVSDGFVLPQHSVVSQCTAIGFTAKGDEKWLEQNREWKVEALGIPPFPGRTYPRVVGFVTPLDCSEVGERGITYLKGDATAPRGSGFRIVAHIVSDRGIIWGAGFGRAVRKKWPSVQSQFATWAVGHRGEFNLGSMHFSAIDESLALAHLVAQHGFGPSRTPRIRYGALETCLHKLAEHAAQTQASVHMPRIGTGEAGGSWDIVSEIIENTLLARRVDVTVYDLPGPSKQIAQQSSLSF